MDTLTSYTVQLRRLNLIYEYTESYMSTHRKQIESSFSGYRDFRDRFNVDETMLSNLIERAEKKGVKYNAEQFERDKKYIKMYIKFQIARDIWGNEGGYSVFVSTDEQVLKAASLFSEAIKLMQLVK